jgi:4-alpha-glucanotransferase
VSTVDRAVLEAFGIVPEYPDIYGTWHHLDDDTARHLHRAMDVPEWASYPPPVDTVLITRPGREHAAPPGELELEDGRTRRVGGVLPSDLPLGYHTLHRTGAPPVTVIVSPGRCLPHPGRLWGWAVQTYALRSATSWGVGDLGDLARFGHWARAVGAGFALINPLDAAIPERPRRTSPYYPSSRRFRDLLYLDVTAVPGIDRIGDRLSGLAVAAGGGHDRIDRDTVMDAKRRALEWLWWEDDGCGHEAGFEAYRAEQGEALERFATFMALAEVHGGGWRSWPARFHDPDGPAVADFAVGHAKRIRFHAWCQWLLDEQLRTAAEALPLMRDLPVGVDPDGADAWVWQDVFATGISVGAPPDDLGPQGQDWKVPAFVPWKLAAAGYRPYIETLRSAFRHAAALRIDHVLGLFRLFWIPPSGAANGTYVRQHVADLLDILALESHRAGAYVVGEDLGTVEDGVREELAARDVLRYRVLWFEDQHPRAWGANALGSVTTHDLPTVAGLWSHADQRTLRDVGVPADEDVYRRMRATLADRTGLSPDATPEDACVAAAATIGAAGSDLVVAQLEDAIAARHRINVPGTDEERPDNWSIPLPVTLEELADDATAQRVVAAIRDARA